MCFSAPKPLISFCSRHSAPFLWCIRLGITECVLCTQWVYICQLWYIVNKKVYSPHEWVSEWVSDQVSERVSDWVCSLWAPLGLQTRGVHTCLLIDRGFVMPTTVLTWWVMIKVPVTNCSALLVSAVQQVFHWQCSAPQHTQGMWSVEL